MAAHTFIIEETVSHALGVDECEEFVTEAIQCYLLAVEIHIAHGAPNIAAGLFQELAGALKVRWEYCEEEKKKKKKKKKKVAYILTYLNTCHVHKKKI